MGGEEMRFIKEAFETNFIAPLGPMVEAFEQEFAEYLGIKYCIGVSSCTSAIFLTLKAWGLGKEDRVIVPAMTFISTPNSVLYTGADIIFCDVTKDTALIDLNQVENLLKTEKNVRAIIPVHLYGQMVDAKALKMLAQKYSVKILEDSAHCIEGERDGIRPGQACDAVVFSFYATKNITSGEGGAVCTNDEKLLGTLKRIRLHGMDKSVLDKYKTFSHWDMMELGYKANLSDIQAALLLPQIKKMGGYLEKREQIARKYERAFSVMGIDFPIKLPNVTHSRHLFTIWVKDGTRDDIIGYLQQKGIGTAVNYRALHLLDYYRKRYAFTGGEYPNTEVIGRRTISLPLYPKLTEAESDYIIQTVLAACDTYY